MGSLITSCVSALPVTVEAIAMPISGLVVTLESPVALNTKTVDALRDIPEVEIGSVAGNKLAIAIDSSDNQRDREIWEMVRQLPGVADVAVAMVAFDEDVEAGG